MPATTLPILDPTTIPTLRGRFAPVHAETDAADLHVEGSLPADLHGVFVRNGPNPRFDPWAATPSRWRATACSTPCGSKGGKARYRNRWVRTQGLAAEERAGRALFGGMMTPAFVDQALLGPNPDPGWPVKLDAFINIVGHAGRYLALDEGLPAYEVSADLETLGRFDFHGGLPRGTCAHPKIDPSSREMVVCRYDMQPPYPTWAVVGADGTVTRPATAVPEVERGYMVHDFAITEHHALFVLGPGILDLQTATSGASPLQWRPELQTLVVVVPRDGSGANTVFELDPFWVWHLANAFDEDGRITVDFPWWSSLGIVGGDASAVTGAFSRLVLDPASGKSDLTHLDASGTEFPRIDERRTGRAHRYLTVVTSTGRNGLQGFEHDRLCRYDMVTGSSVGYTSDACLGEVVFVPRPGGTDELDGYYLTFATTLDDDRSWLYLWDAADFPNPPRARVLVPTRVPNGLHGNWFETN